MGVIVALIAFGVGLIGGGFYWKLQDDIITRYFSWMIYNSNDPYYLASDLVWQAIPYILVIIGVLCLVMAGLLGRTTRTVVAE